MIRLASASLLLVAAVVALGELLIPDPADTRGDPAERRAVRAVWKTVGSKLPAERAVRCRRARRARGSQARGVRFGCRWQAARRLSPNRTRRCRGRAAVAVRGRRVRARKHGRARCRLEVKALEPRFGFHDNSVARGRASPEQVARLAEGTGAGIYRFLVDWRAVEPQRGVYDLGPTDRLYSALLRRGVRPLFVLAWAPSWAWGPLVKCQGEQCRFPPAPEFYGDWRRVNATLATRYPKAAGIEIWNEPNESSAWNYTADPGAYLDLLREGYKAIKAANPSMQVISGGLSNRQETGGGNLSLAEYVQRLFAGGAAQYMDGIGVHPYVQRDDLDGLDKTLDLVRGLRPRDLPIWVTEVGVTDTGPKDGTFYASDDEQANVDVTAYRTFRGQADVKAILIHTLIDPTDDAGDPESGFGVLRGDLSEKPAYCALARETGARRSCP